MAPWTTTQLLVTYGTHTHSIRVERDSESFGTWSRFQHLVRNIFGVQQYETVLLEFLAGGKHLNSTSFPAIAVVSLDVQMAPTSPGTKCSRASASDLAFKLYSPCQDDPIDCPTSLDKMEACLSGSAGDVHGVSSDFCKKVKPTSPLFSVKSVRSLTAVAFRRVGSTRALHQLYSQGLYAWLAVRWEGGSGNGWVVRDMHASARVNDALSLPM
ncbi:hypothetical protein JCM10213_008912 [Rhodosporidiobolus nylandii]